MENYESLNEYIKQEKTICPSSELTERIMADVTAQKNGIDRERWIQVTGIAASIFIALVLGINLGQKSAEKMKKNEPGINVTWNINDIHIENLALYESGNE